MHPAFSVIFFTTLSGAGYGLLFWSALAAWAGRAPAMPLLVAVALALMLVTIGLLSSLGHLGKPQRSWRAFSQWRTSWLSREGVASVLTYVPTLLLVVLLWLDWGYSTSFVFLSQPSVAIIAVCVTLALCALITVVCTAMIYASLTPIPAWRHSLVVPGYLLFSLLTGGLLLAAILVLSGMPFAPWSALAAIVFALLLWLLKHRYWRDIDSTPLPATRGDAVGLPGRTVTRFERPNTEANYITREMAFAVARKHSRRLRKLAILFVVAVPIICVALAWLQILAAPMLATAAVSAIFGAIIERWLFFAEARHLVTLYY